MVVSINGLDLPNVAGMTPTHEKIVNFERDSAGNGHGDVVAYKWKLEIKFSVLTAAQTSAILNATKPFSFSVSFYNPETGQSGTFTGYEGNKSFPLFKKEASGGFSTNEGSLNIIEL